MPKAIDLTGDVYERLTVTGLDSVDRYNHKIWKCRCICGKDVLVRGNDLRNGKTKSCGCLQKEIVSKIGKNSLKYGFTTSAEGEEICLSRTSLYGSWHSMIQRCTNSKYKCFKDYGGRGIKVCEPWFNDFMAFAHWAYENGYYEQPKNTPFKDQLSIDRIDSDGNYEPSNCRWITVSENAAKRNAENAKKNKD